MGIDHGRLEILMTQQLLDSPDVISFLQKMGGKAVSPMPNSA